MIWGIVRDGAWFMIYANLTIAAIKPTRARRSVLNHSD